MKPLIALSPYYQSKNGLCYSTQRVFNAILDMGGFPVILPFVEEFKEEYFTDFLDQVDGFLFTGGQDFSANYYGEEDSAHLFAFAPPRDTLEFGLMPLVLEKNIPTLGICRGMQVMNVVLGGSLYQHIEGQIDQCLPHNVRDVPIHQCVHKLVPEEDEMAPFFFGQDPLEVNSRHHQALKELGKGLKAIMWSEDGLVEAIYGPDYQYLVGVQWHPEHLYQRDPGNHRLFESFIEAAIQHKKEKIRRKDFETL